MRVSVVGVKESIKKDANLPVGGWNLQAFLHVSCAERPNSYISEKEAVPFFFVCLGCCSGSSPNLAAAGWNSETELPSKSCILPPDLAAVGWNPQI